MHLLGALSHAMSASWAARLPWLRLEHSPIPHTSHTGTNPLSHSQLLRHIQGCRSTHTLPTHSQACPRTVSLRRAVTHLVTWQAR